MKEQNVGPGKESEMFRSGERTGEFVMTPLIPSNVHIVLEFLKKVDYSKNYLYHI